MRKTDDFIKMHAVPIYFALAFAISWGAMLILAGPHGIPAPADQRVMLAMMMPLGPSIAGLLLTGLVSGRIGFRELGYRLLKWKVDARWYAVALLTAPLSTVVVLLVFLLFSSAFAPSILTSGDKVSLILLGTGGGLMVGFCEELGWTGFAISRMRLRYGLITTGLILGLLWGLWHFLMFWESDSFSGSLTLALLLARLFSWLPAYRILMVWVYDRTKSLLVVMLMHVSLVVTSIIINPSLVGGEGLAFILVRAVVIWMIVVVVAMSNRKQVEKGDSVKTVRFAA